MYSNMTHVNGVGELKPPGETINAQHGSPSSGLASETSIQNSQSMDSVNTAGEEEVRCLFLCLSVRLNLYMSRNM